MVRVQASALLSQAFVVLHVEIAAVSPTPGDQFRSPLPACFAPPHRRRCCSDLLSGSRSSRFYRSLVLPGKALTAAAYSAYPADKHPSHFVCFGIPAKGGWVSSRKGISAVCDDSPHLVPAGSEPHSLPLHPLAGLLLCCAALQFH